MMKYLSYLERRGTAKIFVSFKSRVRGTKKYVSVFAKELPINRFLKNCSHEVIFSFFSVLKLTKIIAKIYLYMCITAQNFNPIWGLKNPILEMGKFTHPV